MASPSGTPRTSEQIPDIIVSAPDDRTTGQPDDRTTAKPVDRTNTKTLGIVFLVLFLDLVGFSIVFPLFAELMKHYAGQDSGLFRLAVDHLEQLFPHADADQQAALFGGLLTGLYAGIQFIAAPIWGRMSDRIGRRPIILLSLVGSALAYLLWIFSASFELFVLSRIIAGVMSGNVSVANAAVSDVTSKENRSKGMAAVGMAFGLGFVFGPAIGGISQRFLGDLSGTNPFAGPALIAFLLALGNLVWAVVAFRETLAPERRSTVGESVRSLNPLASFASSLGRFVPKINGACLLHTLLFSGMEATLVFLVSSHLGFRSAHEMIWLFLAMGIGSALVQGAFYRPFAKRIGEKRMVLIGLIALIPGLIFLGLIDWWPSLIPLTCGVILLNIGTGIVFPGMATLVSLAGDQTRQGAVMGAYRSAAAFGRATGPLLAALAYFTIRPGAPYLVAAIGMLVPLWLVWSIRGMR